MASLHKDSQARSPYWYAAFYAPDGRRLFRSTKETNRTAALKIALAWEEASRKARRKELTAAQARKVLAELVAASSGEELEFHSVESWLTDWLANKEGTTAPRTLERYRQIVRDFLSHLGLKANASIAAVSPGDLTGFRNALRSEGRSASTCNTVVKGILNAPFERAHKLGYISANPVSAVESLRERDENRAARDPFTAAEIAQLLEVAQGDWHGAILLGATSGLRLGDVAYLRWESVDLENRLLRVPTRKTGKLVIVPMHDDFVRWLNEIPRGIGKAPVFASLASRSIEGAVGLSAQFRAIVAKAGIVGRVVARAGKGRATNAKTFHALRHSFVSLLANANVPPEIRQRLAGHASADIHRVYTHHELATFRAAVATIPSLERSSQ
jgi:integrase